MRQAACAPRPRARGAELLALPGTAPKAPRATPTGTGAWSLAQAPLSGDSRDRQLPSLHTLCLTLEGSRGILTSGLVFFSFLFGQVSLALNSNFKAKSDSGRGGVLGDRREHPDPTREGEWASHTQCTCWPTLPSPTSLSAGTGALGPGLLDTVSYCLSCLAPTCQGAHPSLFTSSCPELFAFPGQSLSGPVIGPRQVAMCWPHGQGQLGLELLGHFPPGLRCLTWVLPISGAP